MNHVTLCENVTAVSLKGEITNNGAFNTTIALIGYESSAVVKSLS